MFIFVKTTSSIFEQVLVESVVNCRMKWSFVQNPFSVEPVLSSHPAIPCGSPLNTGSIV